jgi:hypothetical protein
MSNPILVTTYVDIPYTGDRLPGGSAMITHGKWASRIVHEIKDEFMMGRWTGNIFQLSGNKQLYIITGYRPCPLQLGASTSLSTAHQQAILIKKRQLHNTTPRKQFVEDFIHQFDEICNNPNNFIIFSLDANANINDDPNGLGKIVNRCNLIDLYTYKHEDYVKFGTQQRGSKQIDYILGSQNILKYISRVGYPAFNDCFDSDHRGIFVDISMDILETPIPIIEKRIRPVVTNSTNTEGERYIRHLFHNLKNKIFLIK